MEMATVSKTTQEAADAGATAAKKQTKNVIKAGDASVKKEETKEILPPEFGPNEEKGFSVRVHVIEARELKGREDSGVSDPICFVVVNGQKQKTAVMKKTLNCTWDHCFFFTLHMNKAEFDNCTVRFDIYDANTLRRNVMIGSSAVDLNSIYCAPNHEMYKQWVALTDRSGEFDGVQGFLKFSASAVGDGEELPPPHQDEDEDDNADFDNVNLQDLVLNGPDIQLQEYYLVAKIWHAEGLPKTDAHGLSDPFIEIKFGGRKHKTQIQKKTLDPKWNEELMLPCSLPSLSDRIEILCTDWDAIGSNDLICSRYFSFAEIKEKAFGPRWVHFFGAPDGDCGEWADDYNRGYKEGTCYRGKMLIELSAHPATKPRLTSRNIAPVTEHKFEEYALLVDVYEGSEIIGTNSAVTLDFSVGHEHMEPVKSTSAKKGTCHFYEQIDMKLPLQPGIAWDIWKDPAPDLIVDVYVKNWIGGKERVGYLRIPLATVRGFQNKPQWHEIQRDPKFKYSDTQTPGSVLLKINFGRWVGAPEIRAQISKIERRQYQLRAHMYQGRNLPAADSNGLSDPYAKIRMSGCQVKTDVEPETVNPTWYKSFSLQVDLPFPLEYAPNMVVDIFDSNLLMRDPRLGSFSVSALELEEKMPKLPQWYQIYMDDPAVWEGEVLCSFQLIPLDVAQGMEMPEIRPKTMDCYFEINAVGLRQLVPYRWQAIGDPVVEFDTGDKASRNTTRKKARVKGKDADLLETVHLSVPLPMKEIFAPVVNVRVFDQRVLGKVLVASASIPIAPYLPWVVEKKRKKREKEKKKAEAKKRKEAEAKQRAKEEREAARRAKEEQKKRLAEIEDVGVVVQSDEEEWSKEEDSESELGQVEAQELALDVNSDSDAVSDDEDELEDSEDEEEKERKEWPRTDGAELEKDLADDLPFETFKLFRGRTKGLSYFEKLLAKNKKKGTRNPVGQLKGRFRVLENAKLRDAEDPINLKSVYKPKKMVLRAYIFRGHSITPADDNGFSDPYLLLDSGLVKTKKEESPLCLKTLSPEFYKCFELKTTVPGPPLKITMMDHDDLSFDDVIGETFVDLENRFFCPKWSQMQRKPIEFRTLWTDSSRAPQGKLEMYLEILTPDEAKRLPPRNIAPPPPQPFELRVVIWELRNCVPKDSNGKNDLFVSGMLDGMSRGQRQETDSHWSSDDGTGSFNWRMKFPLQLPYPSPRFKIGLWDKDLLSANDIIAEAILDLSKFFKRAFKTGKGFEFHERWIACYHPNTPGIVQGEVKVSLELLTAEMAAARENGYGRDEPNQYPVLPKPDRPDNSFNPLNPLGWMKYGAGKLFTGAKYAAALSSAGGILFVIIYFSTRDSSSD